MCRSVLFVVSLALLLATQSFKSSAQTRVVQPASVHSHWPLPQPLFAVQVWPLSSWQVPL